MWPKAVSALIQDHLRFTTLRIFLSAWFKPSMCYCFKRNNFFHWEHLQARRLFVCLFVSIVLTLGFFFVTGGPVCFGILSNISPSTEAHSSIDFFFSSHFVLYFSLLAVVQGLLCERCERGARFILAKWITLPLVWVWAACPSPGRASLLQVVSLVQALLRLQHGAGASALPGTLLICTTWPVSGEGY